MGGGGGGAGRQGVGLAGDWLLDGTVEGAYLRCAGGPGRIRIRVSNRRMRAG